MTQQLQKLDAPARCGLSGMRPCGQRAHWQVLDSAQCPKVAVCDACILIMADMNDDNETFFQPALDEIAKRRSVQNLVGWFSMIGLNLALIENEVGIDLGTVHEVEFFGGVDHKDWWMHFGSDVYAQVYPCQGELMVSTHDYIEEKQG